MRMKRQGRSKRGSWVTPRRGGPGASQSLALIAAITALTPFGYFKLSDAAAPYANSGSIGGTAAVAATTTVTARGTTGPDGLLYAAFPPALSALEIPDHNSYSPQTPFSFCFLYKPTTITGSAYLLAKAGSATASREWYVLRSGGTIIVGRLNTVGGVYCSQTTSAALAIGQWVLISGYLTDAGYPDVYINGVLDNAAFATITGTQVGNSTALTTIGSFRADAPAHPDGQIAHVAFGAAAWTAPQHAALAAAADTDGWI